MVWFLVENALQLLNENAIYFFYQNFSSLYYVQVATYLATDYTGNNVEQLTEYTWFRLTQHVGQYSTETMIPFNFEISNLAYLPEKHKS